MSKTFDQGKEEVVKLCRHFTTNRQAFFAPGVKEAHIRQMLIDPFFEALGWDVRSAAMVAPQYREVIPEDSLDVEGQQKAPDYTFRVGTLPKATDAEIDRLVYDLYGLTAEEIAIVEDATK
jgi:hypothetical protein